MIDFRFVIEVRAEPMWRRRLVVAGEWYVAVQCATARAPSPPPLRTTIYPRNRKSQIGNRKFYPLPSIIYQLLKRKGFRFSLVVATPASHYPLPSTHYQLSKRKGFRFSLVVSLSIIHSSFFVIHYSLSTTIYHLPTLEAERIPLLPCRATLNPQRTTPTHNSLNRNASQRFQ